MLNEQLACPHQASRHLRFTLHNQPELQAGVKGSGGERAMEDITRRLSFS